MIGSIFAPMVLAMNFDDISSRQSSSPISLLVAVAALLVAAPLACNETEPVRSAGDSCDGEGTTDGHLRCEDGVWVLDDPDLDAGTDDASPSDDASSDDDEDVDHSDASCDPESDDEFCARLDAECGTVEDDDNCGATRSIDCGDCEGDTSCEFGEPNRCECPCEIDDGCQTDGEAYDDNTCLVCAPDESS